MSMESRRVGSSLLFVVTLSAATASAQVGWTYCCQDERGQRVCGDRLPAQCFNRAYWILNERGLTVKRVDAPLTAEQLAQREAEARRQREQDKARLEQARRDRALLDAYSSEKDIDLLRERALRDIETSIAREQELQAEALKRKKELDDEMEFYRKKAPPKELADALKENESVLKAHAVVIEAKQKEMDAVRTKYDEERRRYREIVRGQNQGRAQ